MKKELWLFIFFSFLILSVPVWAQKNKGFGFKFEGEGFDSPEEAVFAYIDAFNRQDVPAALNTFAIESVVDHMNAERYIIDLRGVYPAANYTHIPAKTPWIRDTEVALRYREVADELYRQFIFINRLTTHPVDEPSSFKTVSDMDDFLAAYEDPAWNEWFGSIRFEDWVDPFQLSDFITRGQQNAMKQCERAGGEDYAVLIPHLRVGDLHVFLTFDCIRYNGKWYNYRFLGQANSVFNGFSYAGGISWASGDLGLYLMELNRMDEPDAESSASFENHLGSSLSGTTWKLVKVDGKDLIVADSRKSLSALGAGVDAIFGEMHFMRYGCSFAKFNDPEEQDIKNLIPAYGNWNDEDGLVELSGEFTGIAVISGNELILNTDGEIYTFLKEDPEMR